MNKINFNSFDLKKFFIAIFSYFCKQKIENFEQENNNTQEFFSSIDNSMHR